MPVPSKLSTPADDGIENNDFFLCADVTDYVNNLAYYIVILLNVSVTR